LRPDPDALLSWRPLDVRRREGERRWEGLRTWCCARTRGGA
jgi:hypothetical protein